MKATGPGKAGRRGAALYIMLLVTPVVLAMTVCAFETGYIAFARHRLQNAADAAALAGAAKLQAPYMQWSYPLVSASQKASILAAAQQSAQTEAARLAGLNGDGAVTSYALPAADVTFGYLDQNNTYSSPPPNSGFPNSVAVTLRRNQQANGSLALLLGPILGVASADLTATARATVYSNPTTMKSLPGFKNYMLPIQADVNAWTQFVTNGTSIGANNQVIPGPNGAPQLQVYPDSSNQGHFGLLDLGPPASNTPAYQNWIDNGPSSSDIQYLLDNRMLPVSPAAPAQWTPGPGLKSALISDFQWIEGRQALIPLSSGPGSAQIIGFVGVTITEAYGSGGNMVIAVQPMAVQDPTAALGVPLGTGPGPVTFAFLPARLTQ